METNSTATDTTHRTAADLRAELARAAEARDEAQTAYDDAEADGPEWTALEAAEAHVDELTAALRERLGSSDEERTYSFGDGSGYRDDFVSRPSTVEDDLCDWIREGEWGGEDGVVRKTTWIHASYRCAESNERGEVTVTIDPEEPKCTEDEHDWQSPHKLVGGLRENPGVFGHGGGVRIYAACMHCGCGRLTDTWAQDRETGQQGLESVSYTVGEYRDDVAAMRADESDDEE